MASSQRHHTTTEAGREPHTPGVDGSSAPENPEVGQTARANADPSAPPHVETDGQILVDAVLGRFARRTLPMVEAPKVDGSAGVIPQAVEALAPMSNEMASEEGTKPVGAAAPRPSRYALPTAGLALAAVLGSFVGVAVASWFCTALARGASEIRHDGCRRAAGGEG